MERTTVFLDKLLLRRARQLAKREGKSFAAVVREALAAYVSAAGHPASRLPSVTGSFGSGHTDTADHVDELLWTEPHH